MSPVEIFKTILLRTLPRIVKDGRFSLTQTVEFDHKFLLNDYRVDTRITITVSNEYYSDVDSIIKFCGLWVTRIDYNEHEVTIQLWE
jgi:hypothetical protein